MKTNSWQCLTSNQLKIIALIAMTCDHVGKELFPQYRILSMIGRLAFPIFAYMIAEGFSHTHNRKKYLATMCIYALVCQTVYSIATGSLYQCILVTFSLSILLLYVLDNALKKKTIWSIFMALACLIPIWFICQVLPLLLPQTDFVIDYGFFGILLPVFVYFAKSHPYKLILALACLIGICYDIQGSQWYSLCAIPLLYLYNGKRGNQKLKYLFYIYYPLHLIAVYALSLFL